MNIILKNFSYHNPDCVDGDTFESCNLTQAIPGTPICSGVKGLTFKNCNLINCSVPSDAVIEDCNTCQVDRCSHLHPELVDSGLIKSCTEDCKHRIGSEKQSVDAIREDYIASLKGKADGVKNAAQVDVANSTDKNGLIVQTFTRSTYIYKDLFISSECGRV